MIYDYIIENYENDEPIFLSELPGKSKNYLRQEMKRLADEGKIERLYNGVYFRTYKTILGTKGKISIDKYIRKKYLTKNTATNGYYTGITLVNNLGFTTQNPSCIEICSNEATTKQRTLEIDGRRIIIYKPVVQITNDNKDALQLLDLMTNIDKYSELQGQDLISKLRTYVKSANINFEIVKKYLTLFPDRVYKNLYNGGLMNELVS